MHPEHISASPRAQGGNILFAVFFIMLVMAGIGLAMSRVLSWEQESIVFEVMGARALNAANTGAERALLDVFPLTGALVCDSSTNNLALPALEMNCSVAYVCDTVTEGGETIYQIQSTGQCATPAGEVSSRRIFLEVQEPG